MAAPVWTFFGRAYFTQREVELSTRFAEEPIGVRLLGHSLHLGGQVGGQSNLDTAPVGRDFLGRCPESLHDPMHTLPCHAVAACRLG